MVPIDRGPLTPARSRVPNRGGPLTSCRPRRLGSLPKHLRRQITIDNKARDRWINNQIVLLPLHTSFCCLLHFFNCVSVQSRKVKWLIQQRRLENTGGLWRRQKPFLSCRLRSCRDTSPGRDWLILEAFDCWAATAPTRLGFLKIIDLLLRHLSVVVCVQVLEQSHYTFVILEFVDAHIFEVLGGDVAWGLDFWLIPFLD